MSQLSYSARPMGRADIRSVAKKVRQLIGIEEPYFPIVEVIEFGLSYLAPGFVYSYPDRNDPRMGDNHGLTVPGEKLLLVREDIYRGAVAGSGRDRMTMAHELGHAILHPETQLARLPEGNAIATYRDPEWQAKAFAGELLVDVDHALACRTHREVMDIFGVSEPAANIQFKEIQKYRQRLMSRCR